MNEISDEMVRVFQRAAFPCPTHVGSPYYGSCCIRLGLEAAVVPLIRDRLAAEEQARRDLAALLDALRRMRDTWYRQPGWTDAADTVDVLIDAFADDEDLPPGVHRENDGGLVMEPYGPPRDLADFGSPVLIAPPPGEPVIDSPKTATRTARDGQPGDGAA